MRSTGPRVPLLCDLLDAPTALAACCGFDLWYKYILYLHLHISGSSGFVLGMFLRSAGFDIELFPGAFASVVLAFGAYRSVLIVRCLSFGAYLVV